jgi:transcriptional regulator with XRE-family HTH domain
MHAIGKRLKQLRIQMGLSLRDMVVLHGYHESQWRRMEREGAGLQSLLRISKAFGLSIVCILDGVGQLPEAAAPPRLNQTRESKLGKTVVATKAQKKKRV